VLYDGPDMQRDLEKVSVLCCEMYCAHHVSRDGPDMQRDLQRLRICVQARCSSTARGMAWKKKQARNDWEDSAQEAASTRQNKEITKQ
jgi:hypothetical protein